MKCPALRVQGTELAATLLGPNSISPRGEKSCRCWESTPAPAAVTPDTTHHTHCPRVFQSRIDDVLLCCDVTTSLRRRVVLIGQNVYDVCCSHRGFMWSGSHSLAYHEGSVSAYQRKTSLIVSPKMSESLVI